MTDTTNIITNLDRRILTDLVQVMGESITYL